MPHDLVYIALGSNLGDTADNLDRAIHMISDRIGLVALKSSYIVTEPWGYQSVCEFRNAVVAVSTRDSVLLLLDKLEQIEKDLGRQAKSTNGYEDRVIDLDIIDYKGIQYTDERVVVPHPRMHLRMFVLEPLNEISADWKHPALNRTVSELIAILK